MVAAPGKPDVNLRPPLKQLFEEHRCTLLKGLGSPDYQVSKVDSLEGDTATVRISS